MGACIRRKPMDAEEAKARREERFVVQVPPAEPMKARFREETNPVFPDDAGPAVAGTRRGGCGPGRGAERLSGELYQSPARDGGTWVESGDGGWR